MNRSFTTCKNLLITGALLTLVVAVVLWHFLPPKPWKYERESENPDAYTVGQNIQRSQASDKLVFGQFGTIDHTPWSLKAGYVIYKNIDIPQVNHLYLKLRYSKHSPSTVPILVFLDDELEPRAVITLINQGDWNRFAWTNPIDLGPVENRKHTLKLYTEGQEFGVADLDKLVLAFESE